MPTAAPPEPDATTGREPPTAPAASRTLHLRSMPLDFQPILSIRASVPTADANEFIADALRDIRAYLEEHHISPAGPPFSICRPSGSSLDVEAGWPTERPCTGTSRIHAGAHPRSLTGPQSRPHPVEPPEL